MDFSLFQLVLIKSTKTFHIFSIPYNKQLYIYSSQTYITLAMLKKTKMESDEDRINFDYKLLYDSSIKLYIRNAKLKMQKILT